MAPRRSPGATGETRILSQDGPISQTIAESRQPTADSRHPSPTIAELVLIAALAERSRVIGRGLELPWHLPADLKRFKALTLGHPVVMGRRTFEAVLHQIGRPLPGRDNVVLSRGPVEIDHPDARSFQSLDEALVAFEDRPTIFIGGGASLYSQVLGATGGPILIDRMELTIVEADPPGDAFFPPWEHLVGAVFDQTFVERHAAEAGRPAFRFETYVHRRETP